MEGKYIFAIVILGLFFLLIIIAFGFLEYERKKEERRQIWISEHYINKEAGVDYDDVYDEEEPVSGAPDRVEVSEKEIPDDVQLSFDDAFAKIDTEGIEEITGSYDGGDK